MKFALKILAGLALAAAAYFWATGLMDALFGFRSPLRDQPPGPLPADFASEFLGFLALLQILFVGMLLPVFSGIAALSDGRHDV